MNMVEYTEEILGVKLYPFQKQFLQKLEKLPPNSRLISTPKGWMVAETTLIFYRSIIKAGGTQEEATRLTQALISATIFGSKTDQENGGG